MDLASDKFARRFWISTGRVLFPLSSLLLLIVAWQIFSLFTPEYMMPSPRRVFSSLGELIKRGDFFEHIGISFYRVGVGFLASLVLGGMLGICMGYIPLVKRLFELIVPLFQAIPSLCWALLAILWFGLSDVTPMFVVFTVAFPIMIVNTWEGTKNVDKDLVLMARSFHFDGYSIVRKIVIPSILPYVMAGARLAFGFGWRISILAEALGSTGGVGYKIMNAADRTSTDQVFAWTIVIVAFMMIAEYFVFKPLEMRFAKWRAI